MKEIETSALIKRKDAALYLNVSERWLHRARAHGIPFVKMGKSVYFLITDLDNYIQSKRIGGGVK